MRLCGALLKSPIPKQIEYYSRFSPSPLSIKQFLDFGEWLGGPGAGGAGGASGPGSLEGSPRPGPASTGTRPERGLGPASSPGGCGGLGALRHGAGREALRGSATERGKRGTGSRGALLTRDADPSPSLAVETVFPLRGDWFTQRRITSLDSRRAGDLLVESSCFRKGC